MRRVITLVFAMVLTGRIGGGQVVQMPRDRANGPPPPPVGTGVIKGRVVDAQTGSAVARAQVRLNRMGPGIPRQPVTTDDAGVFAFAGLPSGSFMLMADKSTYLPARYPDAGQTLRTSARPLTLADGQVIDEVRVPMYHGSAITGRVLDAHGDPVEFAQVQALRLSKSGRGKPQPRSGASSNDLGEFRIARLEPGQYLLLVTPRRDMFVAPARPDAPDVVGAQPVPTFYPGVLAIDQAQPISVERGATVSSVDIPLVEGMTALLTGTLVDSSGQPVTRGGSVSIRPIMKDIAQNGLGMVGAQVRPDGTFQVRVPPGEYELEARAAPVGINGPLTLDTEQLGSVRLNVVGDMSGVTIPLGPSARVSGRIVFDGTSPVPPVPANTTGSGPVMFMSPDGPGCRSGRGEVAPDWTFTVEGVFGTCMARFNGIARWFVQSITHEGKDLMDQPTTFTTGQQMRDVEVVMTDKRTELTLRVTDEHATPTRDYVALLFSGDQSKWADNSGRYLRTLVPPSEPLPGASGSPAPGGAGNMAFVVGGVGGSAVSATAMSINSLSREVVAGMPAGAYYVIALNDLEVDGFRDLELLEQLSQYAQRITLTYGVPAVLNLRRITLAPR